MQPIPLVDPQTIHPILAFRERVGEHLHLPPVSRAANAPLPLAYIGHLLEELAVAKSISYGFFQYGDGYGGIDDWGKGIIEMTSVRAQTSSPPERHYDRQNRSYC